MTNSVDYLRKLCNHADLVQRLSATRPADYGLWSRSGKLIVVEKLLRLWKEQGHKTLIFVQTKQMLDILEAFIVQQKYSYFRLDGSVPIKRRMSMIDEFNNSEIMVFILTTKVGGIGVNLVGANRVILYEPDWNPSTDVQARERSWRIGQKKVC